MVIGLEPVACVVAVIAGAAMISTRAPRPGDSVGWVYPAAMTVTAVAVLVVDA